MSVVAVVSPATEFRSRGQVITPAGVTITDPLLIKYLLADAAAAGVGLTIDGVVNGLDPNPLGASFYIPGFATPVAMPQGSWTLAYTSGALGTAMGYNFSAAQNDDARFSVYLTSGTWKADLTGSLDPSRAIVTYELSFDGGTTWPVSIGTWDQNAAHNDSGTVSRTFTIPRGTGGRALLRMRNPTRTSTTGWYMTNTGMFFQRVS